MRKWFCRFIVGSVDSAGVMLLFGPKRTPTYFPWHVLEGVVDCLKGRGWLDPRWRAAVLLARAQVLEDSSE